MKTYEVVNIFGERVIVKATQVISATTEELSFYRNGELVALFARGQWVSFNKVETENEGEKEGEKEE